jgi:hypothetical protein
LNHRAGPETAGPETGRKADNARQITPAAAAAATAACRRPGPRLERRTACATTVVILYDLLAEAGSA